MCVQVIKDLSKFSFAFEPGVYYVTSTTIMVMRMPITQA